MSYVTPEKRDKILDDARTLLDWLEAHPDIPLDSGVEIRVSVMHGSDEADVVEVHRIAEACGVEVTTTGGKPVTDADTHRHAIYRTDTASYQATAIAEAHMDAYTEYMKGFHRREVAS